MRTSKKTMCISKIGKRTIVFVSVTLLISFGLVVVSSLNKYTNTTKTGKLIETSELLTGQETPVNPAVIIDSLRTNVVGGPLEISPDDADCSYVGHVDEIGNDVDCTDPIINVEVVNDDADCTSIGHIEEIGDDADCTHLVIIDGVTYYEDCVDVGHIEEVGDDADCNDISIVRNTVKVQDKKSDVKKDDCKDGDVLDAQRDLLDEQ
ncbi:MAG: hypothetical protein WCI62_00315 [Erysipelotrichaceae bacterium]